MCVCVCVCVCVYVCVCVVCVCMCVCVCVYVCVCVCGDETRHQSAHKMCIKELVYYLHLLNSPCEPHLVGRGF